MRRRRPARDLRTAIDCLPLHTREAMLDGIAAGRIIVGAYTDRQGGVCPMLAAHRNGGRTSLASFARAWDRYTGAPRRPRPATPRELTALRAMLEGSIGVEEVPSLHDVPRPDASYPVGWAWLRPVRRLDDYRRALAELDLVVPGPDELELGHDAVAGSAQ
ncbi:MAG: hypothetical protein QOK00_1394 [Thermoleophilaceae bacterium]|nr:hypothetical protein [Thermoleophilaceae bacterium]